MGLLSSIRNKPSTNSPDSLSESDVSVTDSINLPSRLAGNPNANANANTGTEFDSTTSATEAHIYSAGELGDGDKKNLAESSHHEKKPSSVPTEASSAALTVPDLEGTHIPQEGLPRLPLVPLEADRPETASILSQGEKQSHDNGSNSDYPSSPSEDEPANQRSAWQRLPGIIQSDGRREIREKDCLPRLGWRWPKWKKWMVLTVIFWIQMSMNYNTSVYPNAIPLIAKEKNISEQKVRVSQLLFLVSYAIGCELWAPWSEEYGRKPIMQMSLFLVNIWQILCALAPNFGSICVGRALGGLSSAGGSVTLGMCADLFESNRQGFAVAYIVLSSVGGTSIGPIFGGLQQKYLNWHWNFWIQLIFGGVVQAAHLILVPETRSTILMDKEAKRRRKHGEDDNIWGPHEIHGRDLNLRKVLGIWKRPFEMFIKEPIVLCLSLLSGFSDALIFVFSESFSLVYGQWGFGPVGAGLAFIPIVIGYILCYFIHLVDVWRQVHVMNKYGDDSRYAERRMLLLLYIAPLEAIGLLGFAWTSMGPSHNPWIAPMIFSALIAMANYSIYMSTIDYMVAAYGPYSASATGGNGFARDALAGISAMYSVPMYENIGTLHLQWASTILGVLAAIVAIPIYIFYFYGPQIRKASKFAQTLAADKDDRHRPDDEEANEAEYEKELGLPGNRSSERLV